MNTRDKGRYDPIGYYTKPGACNGRRVENFKLEGISIPEDIIHYGYGYYTKEYSLKLIHAAWFITDDLIRVGIIFSQIAEHDNPVKTVLNILRQPRR